MAGRLEGKRALVYGGGTGIGLAAAEAMAREVAGVFISSRRADVLRGAAERLNKAGRAGFEAGDATSVEDVQRVTAAAIGFLGGLDTVVVSAGAGGRTSIFDADPDEFQRIVADPASVSVIRYTPTRPFLVRLNDTADLSALVPVKKADGETADPAAQSDAAVGGGAGGGV